MGQDRIRHRSCATGRLGWKKWKYFALTFSTGAKLSQFCVSNPLESVTTLVGRSNPSTGPPVGHWLWSSVYQVQVRHFGLSLHFSHCFETSSRVVSSDSSYL